LYYHTLVRNNMNAPHLFSPSTAEVPYTIPTLDPTQPVGFIIAGQSQAGKTTAQGLIRAELGNIDALTPQEEPPAFPLSNGLRALAADMLLEHGIDPETYGFLGKEACLEMIEPFAGRMANDEEAFLRRVYDYYANPQPKQKLRNDAVDSAVPYISEDEILHPLVFRAAGQYLHTVMHTPSSKCHKTPPRAVVLDGRNAGELATMLSDAEVALGGLFVLTCGEDTSVRRRMQGEPEADIVKTIEKQKERNNADRDRPLAVGPTTMPEDVENVVALHDLIPGDLSDAAIAQMLFVQGAAMSRSIENAVHIDTDTGGISPEDERRYLTPLLHGMITGVQIFSNR
jgi:hypothetical protein